MTIKMTPEEKQAFFSRDFNTMGMMKNNFPKSVNVGMNNVPVLDQGSHGSCTTFAVTAGIDAALNKGDYVSQLCSLELGNYLSQYNYIPNGWNGSNAPFVFNQILNFGIINKVTQRAVSCAGYTEYPTTETTGEGSPMPLDEYALLSEDISKNLFFIEHVNARKFWTDLVNGVVPSKDMIRQAKSSLARGNRLVFGVVLPGLVEGCVSGACASHSGKRLDTWAMTSELYSLPEGEIFPGHSMIIYGYDDAAVAFDHDGQKHRGLFLLRNSWSENAGDDGNFYMTYDYFRRHTDELVEIVPTLTD